MKHCGAFRYAPAICDSHEILAGRTSWGLNYRILLILSSRLGLLAGYCRSDGTVKHIVNVEVTDSVTSYIHFLQ